MFSNGCAGVFFNDSSKMTSDIEERIFQYVTKSPLNKEETLIEYQFSSYPPGLKKKKNSITIL